MTTTPRLPLGLARILAPLILVVGALAAMLSPAGATLTAPGELIEAAPRSAIGQTLGVQPAVVDRGGLAPDTMPPCATVRGETDPIKCLPIVRWSGAMAMHDTVEFNISQPIRSVEVNLIEKTSYSGILAAGNFLWLAAALLVNAVTNFQVSGQLVKPLNEFAAGFGTSIIDSGAIFLILAGGAAAMIAAATRGGLNFRRLGSMIAAAGAFSVLVWGATNDRGEGASYEPGVASPAWLVQQVSGAFRAVADKLAMPLSNTAAQKSSTFSSNAAGDPTSCKSYIDALHRQYTTYYTDRGETAPATLSVMSRWWEETGYRAFADVQYGDQSAMGTDYAACQQMETNADVTPQDRNAILEDAWTSGEGDYSAVVPVVGSPMINGGSTNSNRAARQNQAWMLCEVHPDGSYTLRSDLPDEGIEGGKIGGPLTPEACRAMFTGDGFESEARYVFHLPFEDKISPDVTVKELSAVQFAVVGDRDLLSNPENGLSEHTIAYFGVSNVAGTIRTTPTVTPIAYAVGALLGGLAMAVLAGALMLMKLLSFLMAFFLIIAALAGIVSQGFGSAVSFFRSWVGYSLITSITTLLFAVVQMVATALVRAGDTVLGQWSWASMAWIGLCPALAIFCLNWAWKRLFQKRSPFTLRGMQAMAGNPLAVAGAAGAGGMAVKGWLEEGRSRAMNGLVGAAKNRVLGGSTRAALDSKSAAAQAELVADAENPVQTTDQANTQKAVTSGKAGAGAVTDGADTSAAETTDSTITASTVDGGETEAANVEGGPDGVEIDSGADDSMVANALNPADGEQSQAGAIGADGRRSFRGRLDEFDRGGRSSEAVDSLASGIERGVDRVGAGMTRARREGRLAVSRVAAVPSNLRRQITGGAGLMKGHWNRMNASRRDLWERRGLVGQYLATQGVGAATRVVGSAGSRLSSLARDPQTYKRVMKSAALYGGLTLATGGLAVPAAVLGGRALLAHRQKLAGGAATVASAGAGVLTGVATRAYRAGVPEMSWQDHREAIESMELDSRIRADQSEDVRAPITELAQGLPVVQERQLAAEIPRATEELEAFQEIHGRAPRPEERADQLADLPFYSAMETDPELRAMFDLRVAEETARAEQIMGAHMAEHGEPMQAEQVAEATRDLPFYTHAARGLTPAAPVAPVEVPSIEATAAKPAPVRMFDPARELPAQQAEPALVPATPAGRQAKAPVQRALGRVQGQPTIDPSVVSGTGRRRAPAPTDTDS